MTETILGVLFMGAGLTAWSVITKRTGDLLHPLGLMVLFWFVVFGFGHLDVPVTYDEPYYALPFELTTYAVVLCAAAVFAFGYWLVDPDLPMVDQEDLAARLRGAVRVAPLRILTLVLFALASATTLYFIQLAGRFRCSPPGLTSCDRCGSGP